MSVLPAEVWARVFEHVAPPQLAACARVQSVLGSEAERALYAGLAFNRLVPVLRLRRCLLRAPPHRRARRLRSVRTLLLLLAGLSPAYAGPFPSTFGALGFHCRAAIRRALAQLVAQMDGIACIELDLPLLPGAVANPFDLAPLALPALLRGTTASSPAALRGGRPGARRGS